MRAWDSATDPAQIERAEHLRGLGVEVILGGDGLEALGGVATVVKSPGVPPEIPLLAAAERLGIEVLDELEIGWRLVPAPTFAVTGTNGKSTVAALCVAVLTAHGFEPALAGNTDFGSALSELSLAPPPRSVVAEVSSYQAEASPALAVDAAIFTNLTPDHLNRHATMEKYGAAKRRLFIGEGRVVPLAVLNADDKLGRELAADVAAGGGTLLRYGRDADADYRIDSCRWGLREGEASLATPTGPLRLQTRLPGAYNAANATAVLALADALGLPREPTLAALAAAAPVPGRFEVVDADLPFDVVVDLCYAEDSVAQAIAAARALVAPRRGRLLTVLGIVGRSAALTGEAVGAIARQGSDRLVLSGTSYRGEPRVVNLATLAAGARAAGGCPVEIVIDRRQAILRALEVAEPGDLVLILGRGPIAHEATDTRGGYRPLDDRQVVREFA